MEEQKQKKQQMSEAWITVMFLSASGGLQDAYTYFQRGGVFANAQTGNIVLLSEALFRGDFLRALHYLIPLAAFALGVAAAELIRARCREQRRFHWRQAVLAAEIVLLSAVALFPAALDLAANALVSFSCAMQVQAFRKVDGFPFASTMCIGNLRSGVDALCAYGRTGDEQTRRKARRYFSVIFLFALGAGLGGVLVPLLGGRTILLSCALLTVSLLLMFREEAR